MRRIWSDRVIALVALIALVMVQECARLAGDFIEIFTGGCGLDADNDSCRLCWSQLSFSGYAPLPKAEPKHRNMNPDIMPIAEPTPQPDQKAVEEALRESEAGLRVLLESTNAIPWVADAQSWRMIYVGPQAAKLLGYPVEAWFEKDFWAEHVHPEDRDGAIAFCREQSGQHAHFEFEYRMLAADGRSVWIHDVVNVVAENGTPKTLRGFLIDVTARRQAAEESRALGEQLERIGRVTLMGELVASITHEVNQPLCAIVGNSQAIQRMLATGHFSLEEVREALQDIVQDGQRASAVIARMRGLLQKAPAERGPVDVNDLIREMAALMRADLARRGIAVRLDLTDALTPVLGDRVQLQQVVLNLMANGAEAMDRSPVSSPPGRAQETPRELIVRSTAEGTANVAVAVVDAGIGLPAVHNDQIFDPFFTTKHHGTGMGLTICKRIVEAHGGRIWASANADGGATFKFTLPVMRPGRVQ